MFLKLYSTNKLTKRGFSLIEILVTLVIVGILGTVATQTLINILRNQSKAEIIKEVKQNGDYVLSKMEVEIRNARAVGIIGGSSACNTSGYGLTITNPDNSVTNLICINHRLQEQNIPATVPTPLPSPDFLSNALIQVADCTEFFTCNDLGGDTTKIIHIKFTLEQAATNPTVAEQSSQAFESEISLRNK
jgi:prepilin-type N-terminal cleavage/methylation domain-containing protein